MTVTTAQRNWRQESGTDEFRGAQRKMLRLAPDASPADGERGREVGAATTLNLRGASLNRAGEVQVPGRAVFTCAFSAPWGTRREEALGGRGEIPSLRGGSRWAPSPELAASRRPPPRVRRSATAARSAGKARVQPCADRVRRSPGVGWSFYYYCSFKVLL